MERIAHAVVCDTQTGRIETGHVDRARVEHLLWTQPEAVAVDATIRSWNAAVSLIRLHLAIIHRGQLGRAGVVVDHQRSCGKWICGKGHWNASGWIAPEVEPIIVGRRGISPDSPDDLLHWVVEADAVIHSVGSKLDGLGPQELSLVDNVLALAVGKGGAFGPIEVDQIAEHVHVRNGIGNADVGAVGRAEVHMGSSGSAHLVALRQRACAERQLAVVPVESNERESLFGEAVKPKAHGDKQRLIHERRLSASGLAGIAARHLGQQAIRRGRERLPHLEKLGILIVKLVSSDVDCDFLQKSVTDGVHPERVRPRSGVVIKKTTSPIWGVHNARECDRYIHTEQQVPRPAHLARELLAAKSSSVVKLCKKKKKGKMDVLFSSKTNLHLDFADGKVGVASICGLLLAVNSC